MRYEFEFPKLRLDEIVALRLRALYEGRGYRPYHMGSLETYDLYMQNKSFLVEDDVITFTGADGRLMALKPDVTMSIVKNTQPGAVRRVYYTENVFRRSRQTGEYREISQMGLEFIGGEGGKAEAEVLRLAAESLAVCGEYVLDISHMEFVEAMLAPFTTGQLREAALEALRAKSPHGMAAAAEAAGLSKEEAVKLSRLTEISGPFEAAFAQAQALAADVQGAPAVLEQLSALVETLRGEGTGANLQLDFSILNDADYYNGLIFQGFVNGAPRPVLSGGRYDSLLRRFEKPQGAVGFGLHLDVLAQGDEADKTDAAQTADVKRAAGRKDDYLNIALPKGRLGNQVYELFEKAGFACEGVIGQSRKLVFEDDDAKLRYFLVKPSDVDIYVEHGAADIGVVGKDVLLESGADVLELFDLGLGKCRLAVAGKNGYAENLARTLRVATKYPAVARRYYAEQSRSVEIIKLHGSIELAPLLGLSDVIVDIVETGSTLRENDLAVLAAIVPSSARLIANRAAWRFKQEAIRGLTEKLGE